MKNKLLESLKLTKDRKFLCYHKKSTDLEVIQEINRLEKANIVSLSESDDYVNIELLKYYFNYYEEYSTIIDAFSPNRNKDLHIGHLSNLVIGNAISKLINITPTYMLNSVPDIKDINVFKTNLLFNQINFKPTPFVPIISEGYLLFDNIIPRLIDGTDSYINTKCIVVDNEKKVCIKNNGDFTYLLEDMCLLEKVSITCSKKIIYVTGSEQASHFEFLKKYSNFYNLNVEIEHVKCGLISISGEKMSSRKGNVILIEDYIEHVSELFNNNHKIAWNVIAGKILESSPQTAKNIHYDTLNNPKNSTGLYLTYTLIRIKNAFDKNNDTLPSKFKNIPLLCNTKTAILSFVIAQAGKTRQPQKLLNYLRNTASELNSMYSNTKEYSIANCTEENFDKYSQLYVDLFLGMNILGLHTDIENI
jgi:arginyl-tRNA synthetase